MSTTVPIPMYTLVPFDGTRDTDNEEHVAS